MKNFAAALALASVATAIPVLEARQASLNPIATILPTISNWNSGTSTIAYNTGHGLVSRSPSVNGDTSTLLSFAIPTQYASNTCQLTFSLTQAGSSLSGTGAAQIFTDSQPARAGATSSFRNNQIAILQAVAGGHGTFTFVNGTVAGQTVNYPCSQLIQTPNLEVVPSGESDNVAWQQGDGLKITVY